MYTASQREESPANGDAHGCFVSWCMTKRRETTVALTPQPRTQWLLSHPDSAGGCHSEQCHLFQTGQAPPATEATQGQR